MVMKNSRNHISSEKERLDNESTEIQENLDTRASDLESVSEVFDLIVDGGTDEGLQKVLDKISQAQGTGADKFDETNNRLDEKTQEVQENQGELKEGSNDVNENIDNIRQVEGRLEGDEVKGEVQNAEQSAIDDFEFLEDAQNQLREISEKSQEIAEQLQVRASAAKSKGAR